MKDLSPASEQQARKVSSGDRGRASSPCCCVSASGPQGRRRPAGTQARAEAAILAAAKGEKKPERLCPKP